MAIVIHPERAGGGKHARGIEEIARVCGVHRSTVYRWAVGDTDGMRGNALAEMIARGWATIQPDAKTDDGNGEPA